MNKAMINTEKMQNINKQENTGKTECLTALSKVCEQEVVSIQRRGPSVGVEL